ncbi:MAG: response regulator [Gammaproteobacteria bacterium]
MHTHAAPIVAAVDDDIRVLESLQELLESAGYETRLFRSAMQFLESGELSVIHCLISDIRMPVMDGWQLESVVAAARPNLPIVMISGDDVAQREARQPRVGTRPRVLLEKPFNAPQLLATIKAVVDELLNPP